MIGKHLKKAKLIYNIQDFNPEQVQAVEFTSNKLILDMMMMLDKHSCKAADKVIVVGKGYDCHTAAPICRENGSLCLY